MTQSWTHIPNDYDHIYYCVERSNDTVILGGRNESADPVIVISYNMGSSWIDVWENLPFQMYIPGEVRNLELLGNRLFAGNPKNGLWYRDDLLVSRQEQPPMEVRSHETFLTYPNPAFDYINISGIDDAGEYRLFDLGGMLVQHGIVHANRIEVNYLPKGVYFLEISNENVSSTRKIIKY